VGALLAEDGSCTVCGAPFWTDRNAADDDSDATE
jgi:hypothetical protein